jgi:anti-sigma factor RsiW
MSCDQANEFIEAAAVGEPLPDPVAAHLGECRRCAARLALARRIDLTLQRRPIPAPPPNFTAAVLRRLRDERWHAERVVDLGFNLAVSFGVLAIFLGLAGLAWRLGVVHIDETVLNLARDAATEVARRAATDTRILMFGTLLVSTAVALWWWAQEEVW